MRLPYWSRRLSSRELDTQGTRGPAGPVAPGMLDGGSMGPARGLASEFDRLLDHLRHSRGFYFTTCERATLVEHIDTRPASVGAPSYDDYIDCLEVHPDEFQRPRNRDRPPR